MDFDRNGELFLQPHKFDLKFLKTNNTTPFTQSGLYRVLEPASISETVNNRLKHQFERQTQTVL